MRTLPPLLATLLAASLALAGCLTPTAADGTTPAADEPPASGPGEGYAPATGEGAVGFLDSYVMTHPHRNRNLDTHDKARDSLAGLLEGWGLTVERHAYQASTPGVNILGIQPGTQRPDEWIVLSAHYDTYDATVYGAWDDGAGVAMLLELARAGATRTYNRTVVYAFFDGEEKGLLGSAAFVQDYQERATFVANLNFDPPGLNWPCKDAQGDFPVKIIFNPGKVEGALPGYVELRDAVVAGLDAVGVPEAVRDYDTGIPIATVNGVGLRGTSDHANFDKIDVPNVFIGGTPTSHVGPVSALSYLLHTPLDTVAQMELRCGGRDLMKQAFQVEIDVTVHALALLDGPLMDAVMDADRTAPA